MFDKYISFFRQKQVLYKIVNNGYLISNKPEHEREHGKIPPNAIVNMNSGWANKYPDARLVFGTDNVTDPSSFHFPGWSPEACEMLLQKRQACFLYLFILSQLRLAYILYMYSIQEYHIYLCEFI
jgi:kynurenine formamidase